MIFVGKQWMIIKFQIASMGANAWQSITQSQARGGADIFKMSLEDKVERCIWTENFARTQMMDPSTNATLSLSSMPKRMLSLPSAKILRPWVSHGQPLRVGHKQITSMPERLWFLLFDIIFSWHLPWLVMPFGPLGTRQHLHNLCTLHCNTRVITWVCMTSFVFNSCLIQ